MERRSAKGSPKNYIVLEEPLSQYTREELLAWTSQENVPVPRMASKEELIKIIENSSILGGSGRIFPINPNEPTPDVSVLPHETTQEFMHYLPLDELIKFCSVSSEFSKYCKDSRFWESRSEYIHDKHEIIQTLENAIKYGIIPLALHMIEKLPKEKSDYPELSKVLLEIIQSAKLPLIRKVVEIYGKEFPEIFQRTKDFFIRNSMSTFTRKIERLGNSDEIIKTVYMLYVAFINRKLTGRLDLIFNLIALGDKAIEYSLSNVLRDVPEDFDREFQDIMMYLIVTHDMKGLVKYWNEYSSYLKNPERTKKNLAKYDKHPYPYIEAIGGITPDPFTLYRDLIKSTEENNYDRFVEIWNKYRSSIDQLIPQLSKHLTELYGVGNKYLAFIRDSILDEVVSELLWLAKEDALEEFTAYWNENHEHFWESDKEELVAKFAENGVPEKYDKIVMK
jgi:hypothetical protein